MTAPSLTPAQQYVKDQAHEAAVHGLRRACAFIAMKQGRIGFKGKMRRSGMPAVFVRWDSDDVIRCYDTADFQLLYQSEPGHFERLLAAGG